MIGIFAFLLISFLYLLSLGLTAIALSANIVSGLVVAIDIKSFLSIKYLI